MNTFWESRYGEPEYAYGTQPNEFFKSCLDPLKPGRILLPAEGEGRNAVYAAQQGWVVDAFDFSEAARRKALRLAHDRSVTINFTIDDLEQFSAQENRYDFIGLMYVHMPPGIRQRIHQRLVKSLKTSGLVVLESFHKEQFGKLSGGPQNPFLLYDEIELQSDFALLNVVSITKETVELSEGIFHQGSACVVRMVAHKL